MHKVLPMHMPQETVSTPDCVNPFMPLCRKRLEAVRKQHAELKQQLEGQFSHLDGLEAKVGSFCPCFALPCCNTPST